MSCERNFDRHLFGDKHHHVEISAPMGSGGATYYVIINKFNNGSMIKTTSYGWQIHLDPTTILQGDDVSVMIDLIETHVKE